jgi:hypothetical protein
MKFRKTYDDLLIKRHDNSVFGTAVVAGEDVWFTSLTENENARKCARASFSALYIIYWKVKGYKVVVEQ